MLNFLKRKRKRNTRIESVYAGPPIGTPIEGVYAGPQIDAPMECVYAGPPDEPEPVDVPLEDVYAGPGMMGRGWDEEPEEAPYPQNYAEPENEEDTDKPADDEPIACVYAGPEYFRKNRG